MIRALLAEDNELIRLGMRTLLFQQNDIELVGEACSFQELICLSQQTKPDIILLELNLKDEDVTPKIPEILKYSPLVLILTDCKDRETHKHALRLGAIGIVTKDKSVEHILKSIRSVCSGEIWADHSIMLDLWRNFTQNDGGKYSVEFAANRFNLTPRELEVARLAAHGLPAKKIAAKLCISDKTVRNQLTVIYNKLGVSCQVELVLHAVNLDLLAQE